MRQIDLGVRLVHAVLAVMAPLSWMLLVMLFSVVTETSRVPHYIPSTAHLRASRLSGDPESVKTIHTMARLFGRCPPCARADSSDDVGQRGGGFLLSNLPGFVSWLRSRYTTRQCMYRGCKGGDRFPFQKLSFSPLAFVALCISQRHFHLL